MSKKLKLFVITVLSFLFSITMMSIFYVLSYLDIQKYPTFIFYGINIEQTSKVILVISLNIVFTLMLFLYSFIELYISFIDNKSDTLTKGHSKCHH